MRTIRRAFLAWLPLGLAVTVVCGLVYAVGQQNYRQSLNDPQIQIAEDAAAKLSAGARPEEVISKPDSVDITQSLDPWLALYTADGVGIVSSGQANGEIPVLPLGVFATSTWKQHAEYRVAMKIPSDETRFTWQSGAGVRQALVMVRYDSQNDAGFVVAGRNMREVETRSRALFSMVAAAWIVAIIASFLTQLGTAYIRR